jgi:hypothetical protein
VAGGPLVPACPGGRHRGDWRRRRAGSNRRPGLVYLLAFLVARIAPGVSLAIYAAMPVLYFLSITVLRSGRQRDREYADFTWRHYEGGDRGHVAGQAILFAEADGNRTRLSRVAAHTGFEDRGAHQDPDASK